MTKSILQCVVLLAATTLLVAGHATPRPTLYLLEAGVNGRRGPILYDGFSFCPDDFSKNGFTVVCVGPRSRTAFFFVNGKEQRLETAAPFTLAGDFAGMVYNWKMPPQDAIIQCKPDSDPSVTVRITIACKPTLSPEFGGQSLIQAPSDTPSPMSPSMSSYADYHSTQQTSIARSSSYIPKLGQTPTPVQRLILAPSDSPRPTSTSMSSYANYHSTQQASIARSSSHISEPTQTPTPVQPSVSNVLRVVHAGTDGINRPIMVLQKGFSICPRDFPGGIAVICGPAGATRAEFIVNGLPVRKEHVAPFAIAGNNQGDVYQWTSFPTGRVTIQCKLTFRGSTSDVIVSATGSICV